MIQLSFEKHFQPIAEAQQKHENQILGLNNVVGVSLGHRIKKGKESDEPVLSVLVEQKVEESLLTENELVPKKLGDIKTDVVPVGVIFAGEAGIPGEPVEDTVLYEAQASYSPSLTRRIRPAMGGFSTGHYKVTAGTIATGCYDLSPFPGIPPKYYILSNNHVLANSNDARIGDPILQPGRADGGRFPADVIGRLSRFIPIRFVNGKDQPCNYVDAAIAETNLQDLDRRVYWAGTVKTLYTAPKINDAVQKAGRTTGFTTGRVTHLNATVMVNYGGGKVAKFCNQIITTNMSAPGDSGSLVTNLDEGAVGLLFAGSASHTIMNNILKVQSLLKIRLTEKM